MMENILVLLGSVIGKPRGWERVVRRFSPPGSSKKSEVYLRRVKPGYLFPVDSGTMIGWHVHFFGTYEPEVQYQIEKILKPGDVAFDIGANVGWHSLRMASKVGTAGKVFSFEPNDSTRNRLKMALEENGFSQVSVEKYALTDSEGIQRFEAPEAGSQWDGTGHLIGELDRNSKTVVSTTIDNFVRKHSVKKIDLIKIDVEGWELPVLHGAHNSLMTLRPRIIFEYEPGFNSRSGGAWEDIREVFDECRYNIFALNPREKPKRIRDRSGVSTNFLAVPSELSTNGSI